jgi:delta-lactam-biosynthetic de-N-acetylase/entry exclusion lipoprotein TrbK
MKKERWFILILMAALVTGCGDKDTPQVQDTMAQTENIKDTQDKQAEENVENQDMEGEVTQPIDETNKDTQEVGTAVSSETTDTTTITDTVTTQEDFDKVQEEQQQTVDVEQISLDGLSTESIGWGSGGDADENNVPVGCTMYQNKYGYLNADFVRTDSEAIYLTFDEGYEYPEANSPTGDTAKILDTLKDKDVKAVFFVTLPYAKTNPDLIQRMIDEGHIIGNHSVNHPSKGLPSLELVEDQQNELTGVHDYMLENYNYTMDLFRYPTGTFSEQSLAIVNNLGYKSVFWSFAYKDWITDEQPDKTEALNHMIEKLHPGAIYLLHAVSVTNTEVLSDFIDAIKAEGYEIKAYE